MVDENEDHRRTGNGIAAKAELSGYKADITAGNADERKDQALAPGDRFKPVPRGEGLIFPFIGISCRNIGFITTKLRFGGYPVSGSAMIFIFIDHPVRSVFISLHS